MLKCTRNISTHQSSNSFYTFILIQNEDQELRDLWTKLKAKTPEYFAGLDIKPSLLHGDLWGGNVGEIDSGPGIYL